ncbi:MAG: tetratricopeptide repeat protein [Pseudomonadota bacterium]
MPRRLAPIAAVALGLVTALPTSAQEMRGLAGAYLAARQASIETDFAAAARYYGRALMRDPGNVQLLENALMAHIGLGQVTRAVPIARQLRETGGDNQIANLALLADFMAREDWRAAGDAIDEGLTVGPLVDGLALAWVTLGSDDTAAAIEAFDRVGEETGLDAFGLYHKALALAVLGDFDAADAVFAGDGEDPPRITRRGVVAHAQVLSQLGRNDDALTLIDTTIGPDLDASLAALRARLESGETVPFSMVENVRDGAAELFYTVASALSSEAADSYTLLYSRVAEHLKPDHTDALLLSGNLLEDMGRYELATESYDSVPREDPAFHVAEIGRAQALRRAGKDDAAIEVLEQLTESHPGIADVFVTLGDVLRQLERYEGSTEAYDRAVALYSDDREDQWFTYFARGITHERSDNWPDAEADFRKSLELRPGQPSVLNYLGYSMVEMKENLDEALSMIEQAVAERPDSGHIVDSLGWALYRLGRYEESVVHMERAAELLPVDPIINDHLGDVYWAVGRKTEARFQWHRALSFEPEEDEAERIRRKLDVGLDAVLAEEGAPPLVVAGDDG